MNDIKSECDAFISQYKARIKNPQFINGLDRRMYHISRMRDEEIMEWFKYHKNEYDNPELTNPNWDQDLIGVLLGVKRLALIDNDEEIDLELKLKATQLCGIKQLIIRQNYYPTTIYYRKENWTYAVILYMYHEKLFDDSTLRSIDNVFDAFQAYLLGYPLRSYLDHMTAFILDFTAIKIIPEYRKLSQIRQQEIHNRPENKEILIECPNIIFNTGLVKDFDFTQENIRALYREYFKTYYAIEKSETKNYQHAVEIVQKIKDIVSDNPIYKSFAYGLTVNDKLNANINSVKQPNNHFGTSYNNIIDLSLFGIPNLTIN